MPVYLYTIIAPNDRIVKGKSMFRRKKIVYFSGEKRPAASCPCPGRREGCADGLAGRQTSLQAAFCTVLQGNVSLCLSAVAGRGAKWYKQSVRKTKTQMEETVQINRIRAAACSACREDGFCHSVYSGAYRILQSGSGWILPVLCGPLLRRPIDWPWIRLLPWAAQARYRLKR